MTFAEGLHELWKNKMLYLMTVQSVVFAVLLVVVTVSSYAFPVLACFENTTAGTLRMAAVLAVRNPRGRL